MHLVSSRILKITAESIVALKGVKFEELFEHSPISKDDASKKSHWIEWDSLVAWIEWLDKQSFGPLNWEQVGRTGPATKSFSYAKEIVRSCISVRFAYRIAATWLGPSLFPPITTAKFELIGKHDIRETLALHPTAKQCPQLFKFFAGSLAVLPELSFGLAPAKVNFQLIGRTAIYDIEVPEQHTLWSRLISLLRSLFTYQKILKELESQQQQLFEKTQLLFQEREELKNVIKLYPDGLFIYRDGKIRYANEKVATFLNVDLSQIVGKEIFEFVHPSSHELIKSRVADLNNNPGKINPHMEFTMIRKGFSEPFVVECTSMTAMFEGKQSVVVALRDLTDRKKLQMKLMQNDRLISLGQLAAGVGHEINNPLCSLLLKLELMQESNQAMTSADVAKCISEIKSGLESIKRITNDLKTLARNRDEDILSNVDVNRVLKATVNMTRNEIEHRARLVFETGEVAPVYANEARLSQVFLNILINAVQSIEPGRADENEISVRTKQVNNHIIVEICDSGSGIPDEMKDRMFQPFQTTKPVGQGTGLGLSICDSIVRKYHGTIEFESNKGKGSHFRIVLPVSAIKELKGAAADSVKALGAVKTGKNERRVLIVDDDKEVLGMFHSIVARSFETTSFTDSREAIKVIAEGKKFDCIVCDLMMPNLGGMEFYQRLKEVSPEHCSRIIFVTGGSFSSVTDQFLRTPGIVIMEKPISYKELISAIEMLIETR